MSDQKNGGTRIEIDFSWLCTTAIVILTMGDPDLLDALIHYFMQAGK